MRLSFSPFHFSVIVAAAAAGFEKAFSLDVKNGEIPSSSRRSLNKSSKKTGPVPRTSEPSPSPSTSTPAPTPPPTVNPIFTVDCTDGGISDHTASLYDEPYPTFSSDGDIFQSAIVENGIIGTGLLPTKGEDQLVYYSKGTAPGACMDDIVNHCAETCDSASNCTAFTTIIYKDGYRQNPFEKIGGVVFFCNLYNSNVPNLPLKVRSRIDGADAAFELVRVFALKTAQVDQPLAVYDPSDAWEKRDVALINLESKWISPALACIATKSYTASPVSTIVDGCTNCLFKTINTIYQPDANCEETGRFTCDKSDLNGVGFNTCASECFFDVGGPNDETCQNTVRVAFLALSGSNAVSCVMRDVYDADKGYFLAPYTCPFMNLTSDSEYPYFPPTN